MKLRPKKVLDKWQLVLTVDHDFRYRFDGWRVLDFGIFKLSSLPDDGIIPDKRHYKGFWVRFRFWLPFEKYQNRDMSTTKKSTTKAKTTTPKKAVARKTKVDWFVVRKEYLTDSTTSYRELAKKYGVSSTTLEKRAKSEGWAELRQELGEKAYSDFTQKLLDTKSEAQSRHLQHWQNLQALANKSIVDIAERSYFTDKRGNLVLLDGKPVPRPINTFELEKLAKALKIAIDGERVVLGIPTSVSALSDPEGNSVWSGFSDMVKAAEKVLSENGQDTSGGNS